MPAVAVIGGALAAGTAAASIAASALTLTSGLALAGGLATMVGGVTGNKKLMTIGAVATLGAAAAGGFGGLFSGTESASGLGLDATTAASAVDDLGAATGQGLQLSSPTAVNAAVGGGDLGAQLASLDTGVSSLSSQSALGAGDLGLGGSGLLSSASAPIAPTDIGATQTFNTQVANTPIPRATNLSMAASGSTKIPAMQFSDSVAGTGMRASSAAMSTPALESFSKAVQGLNAPETGASMFSNFGKFLKENQGMAVLGGSVLQGVSGAYASGQQLKVDERRRKQFNDSVASIRVKGA